MFYSDPHRRDPPRHCLILQASSWLQPVQTPHSTRARSVSRPLIRTCHIYAVSRTEGLDSALLAGLLDWPGPRFKAAASLSISGTFMRRLAKAEVSCRPAGFDRRKPALACICETSVAHQRPTPVSAVSFGGHMQVAASCREPDRTETFRKSGLASRQGSIRSACKALFMAVKVLALFAALCLLSGEAE